MYKCCFLACFCASQRVQRRKAELSLAQIREKLPNGWADWHQIWHTCAHSYWNGYTPSKLPLEIYMGGTWFFLGGQQFKTILGSCPIGTNFGSRLRVHLGMDIESRLNTSRPSIPQGYHKFNSLGKLSNGCTDWHQIKFGTRLWIHLGIDIG